MSTGRRVGPGTRWDPGTCVTTGAAPDRPCPLQFLIHCEGTRFTEKKHQISMQVAQAKGLPSLKHHLLPRTKGFAVTVRSLRNVGKEDPGPQPPHRREETHPAPGGTALPLARLSCPPW